MSLQSQLIRLARNVGALTADTNAILRLEKMLGYCIVGTEVMMNGRTK